MNKIIIKINNMIKLASKDNSLVSHYSIVIANQSQIMRL